MRQCVPESFDPSENAGEAARGCFEKKIWRGLSVAEWILKKRHWVSAKPVRPGIFRLKEGGYLIRATMRLPNGRSRETTRVLPKATLVEAERAFLEAKERLLQHEELRLKPLFCDFALETFERKKKTMDLRSAATHDHWKSTLQRLVTVFGELLIDELKPTHLEAWRVELGEQIAKGELSPRTCNGWFSILRVVCKQIHVHFELPDPARHLKNFDVSLHPTFTEENPNALSPSDAKRFVRKMFQLFPQHFAMTVLGLSTGLRPSSLRPIRRSGSDADVLWKEQAILIRRSQTLGQAIERTKTGLRQKLYLPSEVFEFLRWHESQLTEKQRDSELLFPSRTGGFRSRSVLDKPFKEVSNIIGLRHPVTPKMMRRTFNDLARAVVSNNLVIRSISGHATETMQQHYSTIRGDEQRLAISNVFALVGFQGEEKAAG